MSVRRPLERKPRKRRAPGTGCQKPRCHSLKVVELDGLRFCAKHGADYLFEKRVRNIGLCFAKGWDFDCSAQLQCAHVVPRQYMPVRWDLRNAVPLCGAHHVWFTHRPLEWQKFMGARWDRMMDLALEGEDERPAAALERLMKETRA